MRYSKQILFLIALFIGISLLLSRTPHQPYSVIADDLNRYFLPLIINNSQPATSTSYYLTTVDNHFLHDLGCELGTRDHGLPGKQDSGVVLNFSFPVCFDDGHFGADLYGYGPVSTSGIETAVKSFAAGYYTCTGSDNSSNLVVGVGTNNKPTSCRTQSQAAAHGTAWAQLVTRINNWAVNEGIFHQVQAYGASDIELGWNTPTWSRAWIDGFNQPGNNYLLHFGDAAGCPYEGNTHWSCGTANYPEWTMEDVWYVAWGAPPSLPLPLIYLTNGVHAKQWAYLSQYSVIQHGHPMEFTGVFTQSQFCDQFNWEICQRANNTPEQAYEQLTTELNKHPSTAQILRWKTDIRWIMQSELSQTAADFDFFDEHALKSNKYLNAFIELDLNNSALSDIMQNGLNTKQAINQYFYQMIEISKENPALKDGAILIP